MTKEAKEILKLIEGYLVKNPSCRFTQALFNLEINEFADKNYDRKNCLLRDIFSDTDERVLNRILEHNKK